MSASEPSFIPERDPDTIYGPMGAEVPKDYHPPRQYIAAAPDCEPWQGPGLLSQAEKEHIKAFEPRPPHHPRILLISIATEPAGGFQLATQLKFSDLSSPTQAQAILDVLEELNNRLSAALDHSPI